ncbi:IS3 family transposase [Peribacillus butanolivorans]
MNKVFEGKKKKAGALTIKMILENDFFVTMNHKKIRRLMNKFNLKARIRQANPYKKMAKATHEHKVVPNLLNRKFNQGELGKLFLRISLTSIMVLDSQLIFLVSKKLLHGKSLPITYPEASR